MWLFGRTNRADNDFLQVQDTLPPDEVDEMQRTHPFINHLEELVQNYMQLMNKIIVISQDKITLGDQVILIYYFQGYSMVYRNMVRNISASCEEVFNGALVSFL
jgi:hypothetical protein